MCVVCGKYGPDVLARRLFRLVKHKVWCTSVFGPIFGRAFKKRAGALFRPLGLLRATFKATTKNTAVRRDWRSVWGPFWPKWAWHSRGVHIFKRFVFSSFSRIHAILRVLRSLGGSWASPGTLWGAPGPNDQTKVTATLRPVLARVLRLRAGGQWRTRPRNTTDRRAESLRRDRRVFKNLCNI